MNTPAAIQACFTDVRVIKGRSVIQLCFEVPIEAGDNALLALGGIPQPQDSRWVAIARIQTPAQPVKEPKPWRTLSATQQAAIRINDPQFWNWLGVDDAEGADFAVKRQCKILSKKSLTTDAAAIATWNALDREYMIAVGLLTEPR